MRTIRKNILWLVLLAPALARAAEVPDYGQLGAILGYVAGDYGTAVGPTGVTDPQEFAEQKGFLAEASRQSEGLPTDELDVRSLIQAAQGAAARAAPPDQVVPKVAEALALLERRHDLGQIPKQLPSAAHGRTLYGEGCEACHAVDASGRTALKLSTQPPDLTDHAQSGAFSPTRVFRAATYGVPGTAMPAFDPAYSAADRWDIAFYMAALAHGAGDGGIAVAPKLAAGFTLADLARESDDQLRSDLSTKGPTNSEREAALDWLRVNAPYVASVSGAGQLLLKARQGVADVEHRYHAGDVTGARREAIAAYLDHFEPFEAALRARDPALVTSLEAEFMRLRAAVDSNEPPAQIAAFTASLQRDLLKAEDSVQGGNAWVAFLASLAIAVREGLESALFLSVLLALAFKSGRPRAELAVHLGWMAALLAGGGTWFLSGAIVARGGGQSRELTEGVTVLFTAALMLGASHWILAQASARKLGHFLSHRVSLLKGAGWGLGGLAFFAIYREALEVVVFYRGLLLQSGDQSRAVGLGAVIGLVALAALVVIFQRFVGHKLRPRPLLVTCGMVLCGLSVMMVGEGIRSLQEAGVLGQYLVAFPEVPQIGIFATAQGLVAQGLVLLGLLGSVVYSLRRARGSSPRAGLGGLPTPKPS